MTIHVIKEGDTIDSLAQLYGVEPQRIILDNEIKFPEDLVPVPGCQKYGFSGQCECGLRFLWDRNLEYYDVLPPALACG